MAEQIENVAEGVKEFSNVEFPASSVHRYTNSETGERFVKCYFPEGMQVAGQDMTGRYLNPRPENIKPSFLYQGALQWSYKNDPTGEKKVWAMLDTKDEETGKYTTTHIELDPADIEQACRDYLASNDRKEFIRVDASKVHERQTETGRTFYSIDGPELTVDGANLSKYSFTANHTSAPKEVDGVPMVTIMAVKGEQVKLNPPMGVDAKPKYIDSATVAKGYNAEHNRKAGKTSPAQEQAQTMDKAPAHAAPAQEVAPLQVQNAPKAVR